MSCGIYQIRNTVDGKRYIGSSGNIEKRWQDHRYLLTANKHHTPKLQNAWNKYGAEAFEFEVLDNECPEEHLIFYERVFWHLLTPEYNTVRPEVAPPSQRKLTQSETEQIRAMAEQVSVKEIAVTFNVSTATIRLLLNGKTYDHKITPLPLRVCSEEQKQKLRQYFTGVPLAHEHKAKIGAANKGRKMSAEALAIHTAGQKRRFENPEERERLRQAGIQGSHKRWRLQQCAE